MLFILFVFFQDSKGSNLIFWFWQSLTLFFVFFFPHLTPPQDTLRECPPNHDSGVDYGCNPSLQFISPMYFVSFVLTAQFVLINVVVAVLMKHLDDSNKEAQEEAEMDAEIELELAQGTLCCMGAPSCGGLGVDKGLLTVGSGLGAAPGRRERGGSARGETGEGGRRLRHPVTNQGPYNSCDSPQSYSPAQVSISVCVCMGTF